MALLHYERWEELAPEMEAFELLQQAREKLAGVNDLAVRDLDRAIARLHPVSRDEEGRKEYAARKRGEDLRPQRVRPGEYTQADLDAAVERAITARAARQEPPQTQLPPEGHGG
jgi:hypothetical protein